MRELKEKTKEKKENLYILLLMRAVQTVRIKLCNSVFFMITSFSILVGL